MGKFTGRWSFGDKLWKDYKEIAMDMTLRTKSMQSRRGWAILTHVKYDNESMILLYMDGRIGWRSFG